MARRKDYNAIHARPLPLDTYPLPAFIPSNPFSYLRLAFTLLSNYLTLSSSHSSVHQGYFSLATRSVHVTDGASIRMLWECGFFGKGSLSRSEPEWLERKRRSRNHPAANNKTSGEVTNQRREERRQVKRERAKVEREQLEEQLRKEGKDSTLLGNPSKTNISFSVRQRSDSSQNNACYPKDHEEHSHLTNMSGHQPTENTHFSGLTSLKDREHLQLSPEEAFFLAYGVGILQVRAGSSSNSPILSVHDLLRMFIRASRFPIPPVIQSFSADDPFVLQYVVYHHFRSLGWVIRPGIKFAVDWLLYARGPVFAHAEFAVIVVPSCSREYENNEEKSTEHEKGEWWWLHAINRVQNQVIKSLVLCYVDIPATHSIQLDSKNDLAIGQLLRDYNIREFVVRRWAPNRNRD